MKYYVIVDKAVRVKDAELGKAGEEMLCCLYKGGYVCGYNQKDYIPTDELYARKCNAEKTMKKMAEVNGYDSPEWWRHEFHIEEVERVVEYEQ